MPLATVEYTARLARVAGVRVILDPAPGRELPFELLANVDVLTSNETEAGLVSGIKATDLASAEKAAWALSSRGPETVIITLSGGGVLALERGEVMHITACQVKVVETAGAGDAFNSVLGVALEEGMSTFWPAALLPPRWPPPSPEWVLPLPAGSGLRWRSCCRKSTEDRYRIPEA